MRLAILAILLSCAASFAEDAAEFEARGVEQLKLSQAQPDAIVAAALSFGKAAVLYEQNHDEDKQREINSYLYWCKKKMSLAQMDEFLKGHEPIAAELHKRLQNIEKTEATADNAQKYFDRAESFAKEHPAEHLLIAIRFYEIAGRFKGTDVSLAAQDRSLQEMTQAQNPAPGTTIKAVAAPPTSGRLTVPPPGKQVEIEKTLKDVYKEQYAKTAPADKGAFARSILKDARATRDDPAARYVMLAQAGTLAAQAAELDLFLEANDLLEQEYDADPKKPRRTGLSILVNGLKDPALVKAASAFRTLSDKPDDPLANQNAGKYLCFIKGDADRGLPLLAKSASPVLSALAKSELAAPADGVARSALADAWWDAGEKSVDKEDQRNFLDRARTWYRKALPELGGLSKAKAEKRLGAVSTVATATPPSNSSVKSTTTAGAGQENGQIAGEELTESKRFGPGAYRLTGALKNKEGSSIVISFAPGTVLSNGDIETNRGTKIRAEGTDEKPVIFRNVSFGLDLNGYMFAKATVFENCRFHKVGGWFAYFSTHWRFNGCIFSHCTFANLNGGDMGFDFQSCAFISMPIPEIKHSSPDDYDKYFRWDWNQIGGCAFVNCQVPPSVLLCSEVCNFVGCKFVPGAPVTTKKDWDIELFALGCSGKPEVNVGDRKASFLISKRAYPGPFVPPVNIPEITAAMSALTTLQRAYKWVSKSATFTASSDYKDRHSLEWLNGEHGSAYDDDNGAITNVDPQPYITIDLGRRAACGAFDIQNRLSSIGREETLTVSVSDEAGGPWTELWQNHDSHRTHWCVVADKPALCRYVKLSLKKSEHLQLNEVRIFEVK